MSVSDLLSYVNKACEQVDNSIVRLVIQSEPAGEYGAGISHSYEADTDRIVTVPFPITIEMISKLNKIGNIDESCSYFNDTFGCMEHIISITITKTPPCPRHNFRKGGGSHKKK